MEKKRRHTNSKKWVKHEEKEFPFRVAVGCNATTQIPVPDLFEPRTDANKVVGETNEWLTSCPKASRERSWNT